jgi:MFS family permease
VLLAVYGLIRLAHLRNSHHTKKAMLQTPDPGNWVRVKSLPWPLVCATLAMMFFSGLSCMPFQTCLSAYLIGEVGFEETRAASAWGLIGLVGMVSGFLMGAMADQITIRRGLIVTYLVLSLASVSVMFVDTNGVGLMLVYVAASAFGLSFYAIFGLVPAYISHLFSRPLKIINHMI